MTLDSTRVVPDAGGWAATGLFGAADQASRRKGGAEVQCDEDVQVQAGVARYGGCLSRFAGVWEPTLLIVGERDEVVR